MITKMEMRVMDAVIGIHRGMKKANEPDWEQWRYEIAREIFPHKAKTSLNNVKGDAESAVEWADLPISELKKEK